jgi:hypothetical protein
MIAISGLTDSDPRAAHRREVCQFIDDRLSPADKLTFMRGLLGRDMAEVRMFLERIEGLYASLSEGVEMLYAFAFGFGKHSAAALVHFLLLVTLALLGVSQGSATINRLRNPATSA